MNVSTDTATRAVTVCRGTRRVDVRLPAEVPVAELMPNLLDLAAADRPDDGSTPAGVRTWGLVPVGRPALDWGRSLADAGVDNGDLLVLTEQTTTATGAVIYDVADLAAARVEAAGPRYGSDQALVAWPGLAALAGLVVSALPMVGVDSPPWATTVAAALLTAAVVAQRVRPPPGTLAGRVVGQAVAATAIGCAVSAVAGWTDGYSTTVAGGPAALTAVVCGAAVCWQTEQRVVGAFAVAVGLAAGLAVALDAATVAPTRVALAVGGVAFVALGATPRIAVAAGGMGGLDLLVRSGGSPDDPAVEAAVARSSALLTGLLAGSATVTGAGAVALGAGSTSAIAAGSLLALGLLVRAQSFTRPAQRMVVRVPALVAAALLPAVAGVPVPIVAIVAVTVPLAAYAGLSVQWPAHLAARWRLAVGWLEVALVVALVPAFATAAGLFAGLSETL